MGPSEPRDRKSVTDEKVFRATIELLRTVGTPVTIEAVAARSGVAKTTIYRRYADRNEMLRAALDHYLPTLEFRDPTDPQRTLIAAVRAVSQTIEDCVGMTIAKVIGSDPDDPAAAIVRYQVVQPRIDALTSLLTGWVATGAVRGDLDVGIATSMIMGTISITYARFGRFGPGWPERFVAQLWPALAPHHPSPRSGPARR